MIQFTEEQLEEMLVDGQFLAEGGNGRVSLVKHGSGFAALKICRQMDVLAFHQECVFLSLLEDSEAAPKLLGTSVGPTPAYLMEYCGRRNLEAILNSNRYDPLKKLKLVLNVGYKLQKIHNAGIIHNDMKSDNIVIADDGELEDPNSVRIIDYGLATYAFQKRGFILPSDQFLWMAPEVKAGRPSTSKSDVYSFGMILRHLWSKISVIFPGLLSISREATRELQLLRPTLNSVLRQLEDIIYKYEASHRIQ
ncbi:hypothetical protein SK128_000118 [Halocaridina rubra]|uniref:Protein kinase domain-containing protein n=1 Tax=Halocaridina rubra TaxID=373956 RepID=A0AAN8X7Y3_HALRR